MDAIGIDRISGAVKLSIIDHWDWKDNEYIHLVALQEKVNAYFAFVEDGDIHLEYPKSRGRSVEIDIISRIQYPKIALDFVEIATRIGLEINVKVNYSTLENF